MLEVQYHRSAEGSGDRKKPERLQTTVIYFPDVHNCMPSAEDYLQLRDDYIAAYNDKYVNKTAIIEPVEVVATDGADDSAMDCDVTDKASFKSLNFRFIYSSYNCQLRI